MKRKTKYGVWLHNNTDRRDDEWEFVYACSEEEAKKKIYELIDKTKYSLGGCMPVVKFRKYYGV